MDNFEKDLKKVFEKNGDFDVARSESLRKEIVQMFDKKLKKVKLVAQLGVLILAAIIIYDFYCLSHSQNIKETIVHAIVILILAESTLLIKLWYWVLNAKYGVLKELKQLQLQIAELAGKEPPSED